MTETGKNDTFDEGTIHNNGRRAYTTASVRMSGDRRSIIGCPASTDLNTPGAETLVIINKVW